MGWSNPDSMDEKVGKADKIHVVTNIQNKNVTLWIFYTKQHIYVDSIVKTQGKKYLWGFKYLGKWNPEIVSEYMFMVVFSGPFLIYAH